MASFAITSTQIIGTTPEQISSVLGALYVWIKSLSTNTGNVYVATTRSSVSPGAQDGIQLTPNGSIGLKINESSKIWVVSDTAAQTVNIVYSTEPSIQYSSGTANSANAGGLLSNSGSITNTATAIKASAGQLYGWYFYNSNAGVVYCQIFDAASGSVSVGSTTPKLSFGIPTGSGANILAGAGIQFLNAITIAFTTTRSGGSAPAGSVDYNIFYL